MLIGGYALQYYGRIRATIDIDIAIEIQQKEDFELFFKDAKEVGFTPYFNFFQNPMSILIDNKTGLEIELWRKPDGVEWDDDTLERRKREKFADFFVWVISPEDFMVNKLARSDRGVQDEQDVKSVLVRLQESLDWKYLGRRAKKAKVFTVLREIKKR